MPGVAKPKRLLWRGTAKADFLGFPRAVQREMGYALYLAQMGEWRVGMAKTLKGFKGGTVIEIRERHPSGAYRAVYTVQYDDAVYVLHAFQKKSRKGIETPRTEIELVRRRLKALADEREKQQ